MTTGAPISFERLAEVVNYCATSGVFTWKKAIGKRVKVGAIAGCAGSRGYINIRIDGRAYKAHRLAWLYTYGRWPAFEIDHINGLRSDNRIENMRDVERRINCENQRVAKRTNVLGVLGVSRRGSKFVSQISVNGRSVYIGLFATESEASAAYVAEKRKVHEGCSL